MGIRHALIVLLIGLVVAGVAAPSLLAAPTLADTYTSQLRSSDNTTPSPTATLAYGYQYALSSGKTFTIWSRMSFGDLFNGAAMAALLLVVLIYVIYKVVERWS
jgi:hypothetical protein